MKQLRRLGDAPKDAFARLQRGAVRHVALDEAQFRALERERPELVVDDGAALLVGQPSVDFLRLHYAFPNREAFAQRFPAMLARLLPTARPEDGPFGVRLRFTAMPDRPYVEPVLRAQAFEIVREWIEMVLHDLGPFEAPGDELAPGFVVRPAKREDAQAVIDLEAAAFGSAYGIVARTPDQAFLLEEAASRRVVGLLRLRTAGPGTGHVADLAVHPGEQGRGLGKALLRWALGRFRAQVLSRATLRVNSDNGPAIALYRKLGFVPGERGLDYRRPLDEDEARQVLERNRVSHITVGRRRYR